MKKTLKNNRFSCLEFPGQTCFVEDIEADEKCSSQLLEEPFIGIDFEWQPDSGDSNHPISVAQVCNKSTCFIWLLFKFPSPPPGLHALLLSQTVLKVGCCLRSADLRKLGVSGLAVPHHWNSLPDAFVDIIELKRNGKGIYVKSLEKLTELWLSKTLPKAVDLLKADWSSIQSDPLLLNYAILDAYSVYLIFEKSDQFLGLQASSSSPILNQV
jgi:hypothetical protein